MRKARGEYHYHRMRRVLPVLLILAGLQAEEPKKHPAQRLIEINAKIEDLKRQLERLEEQKRQLLGLAEAPPANAPERAHAETQRYVGPRNGRYHYTPSGRRVYEHRNETKRTQIP